MSKVIIISILIWLAMIGAVVFLIVPLGQNCLSLTSVNSQKKLELAELEKFVPKLAALKQDYLNHLDLAKKARDALPAREEIPELISELTTLASKNALLITDLGFTVGGQTSQTSSSQAQASYNPDTGMPAPTMTEGGSESLSGSLEPTQKSFVSRLITINLSVKGSYQDFKAFLKDAERDLRVLDLRTLSLSLEQTGDKGTEQSSSISSGQAYSFDLEFETYFLPQ